MKKANEIEDKLKSNYPKISQKKSLSYGGNTKCLDMV